MFPELVKAEDRRRILDDPAISMILISAVPDDRAALAVEAMRAGKDVMVDKPGARTGATGEVAGQDEPGASGR